MTPASSILVVGESLVDVVTGPEGATDQQAFEHVATPGGAPLNVAVGLARLGVPTQLLTRFGRDANGERIARHLESSGVRLRPGSADARSTSVARARVDARQQATYEFELSWDPPSSAFPADCVAVHIGSLGTVVAPGAGVVEDLAAQARAASLVVSYDPNVRPSVLADVPDPWRDVRRWAAGATVVKLSDQDGAYLQPGRPVDDLLDELLSAEHTLLAVVTLGERGIRMATTTHRVDVPAPPTRVVDTVGAGDACMAGLLAALRGRGQLQRSAIGRLRVDDLRAVGSAAAAVAALTCSRRGADPPWLRDLEGRAQASILTGNHEPGAGATSRATGAG
ncbi:MAG: carbohydrate kinase family protein [Nocardioidaceae bacterium]